MPKFGASGIRRCCLTSTHLVEGREIHGGANGHGVETDCRFAEVRLWPAAGAFAFYGAAWRRGHESFPDAPPRRSPAGLVLGPFRPSAG